MIQWYPGHMHKAGKEFKKILAQVDLVIEVLDARLPFSSQNPMLARLRKEKPVLKILNKSDLADPERLQRWRDLFEADAAVKTLCTSLQDRAHVEIPALCRQLVPKRPNRSENIYALIAGIPNVGKSTLINRMAGRIIAKTGNEAAVTRMQQRIEVSPELTLIDTPGMLWPNIENRNSGYRLAVSGAIRDTALDMQDVAAFLAEFLIGQYPKSVRLRYGLESLPGGDMELLEAIARKRGCIVSGGRVDFEKVSRLIISECRNGELGPLCFETPEQIEREMAELEIIREQKAQRKAARKGLKQRRP